MMSTATRRHVSYASGLLSSAPYHSRSNRRVSSMNSGRHNTDGEIAETYSQFVRLFRK